MIQNFFRPKSSSIGRRGSSIIKRKSHKIHIHITRPIIFPRLTAEHSFISKRTSYTTRSPDISMIYRKIKQNILLIKSSFSRKTPHTHSCLLIPVWITAPRISIPIHLMHGTKNHLKVIFFDELKKLRIVFVKRSFCHFLSR